MERTIFILLIIIILYAKSVDEGRYNDRIFNKDSEIIQLKRDKYQLMEAQTNLEKQLKEAFESKECLNPLPEIS